MQPLHILLNTAHSGCKPSSIILSSFTHSLQVFLLLPVYLTPLPTTFLQADTQSSPFLYVPHAQTTSIYHASPLQPRSEHPKDLQDLTSLPIFQRHTTHSSHHHTLCSPQALQILSLHCPCLNPICQHTLDTGPKHLSIHEIGCATGCKDRL